MFCKFTFLNSRSITKISWRTPDLSWMSRYSTRLRVWTFNIAFREARQRHLINLAYSASSLHWCSQRLRTSQSMDYWLGSHKSHWVDFSVEQAHGLPTRMQWWVRYCQTIVWLVSLVHEWRERLSCRINPMHGVDPSLRYSHDGSMSAWAIGSDSWLHWSSLERNDEPLPIDRRPIRYSSYWIKECI